MRTHDKVSLTTSESETEVSRSAVMADERSERSVHFINAAKSSLTRYHHKKAPLFEVFFYDL